MRTLLSTPLFCLLLSASLFACGGSGDTAGNGSASGGSAASGSAAGGSGSGGGGVGGNGQGGEAGFPGPYQHVWPADEGELFGPGTIAPLPSDIYDGPTTIKSPITIENVIINGCLRIESDDVVLRNVILNCGGLYPVRAEGFSNALIEYSRINCTSQSKVFLVTNFTDLKVRYNDIRGCEDFFFISGNINGLTVAYNYMHNLNLDAASHADGFQVGEALATNGSIHIQGNWIGPEANGGKTGILFNTNDSSAVITMEDNFFKQWGPQPLRCGGVSPDCSIRHNVYEQSFENLNPPANPNQKVLFYIGSLPGAHLFECNRLEDGSLVQEMSGNTDRVAGTTHVVEGCPPFSK